MQRRIPFHVFFSFIVAHGVAEEKNAVLPADNEQRGSGGSSYFVSLTAGDGAATIQAQGDIPEHAVKRRASIKQNEQKPDNSRRLRACAAAVLFALLVGLLIWAGVLMSRQLRDPEAFSQAVQAMGVKGKLVTLLLAALQVIAAVIPAGPLELAAGYAFGSAEGTLLVLAGCVSGGLAVFLLVRRLGLPFVRLFVSDRQLRSVRFLLNSPRWKLLMVLCYIIPGAPKDVIGYVAGLTDIRIWVWLLTISLGRIPGVLMTVLVGAKAGERNYLAAALLFAGMLLIGGLGLWLYRRVEKKETARTEPQSGGEKENIG